MASSISRRHIRRERMRMTWIVVAGLLWATNARAEEAAAVDYIADARLYYRVVACKGTEAPPATLDAPTIEKHCAEMAKRYERFTEKYVTPAQAFFAPLRPANLPTSVVYPFGGGDLASA